MTVRFERVVGDTTYDRRHQNQATIVVVVFVLPAATGRPPALLLRLQLLLHVVISSHDLSHFLRHVYGRSHTMQIFAGRFSFLTPLGMFSRSPFIITLPLVRKKRDYDDGRPD